MLKKLSIGMGAAIVMSSQTGAEGEDPLCIRLRKSLNSATFKNMLQPETGKPKNSKINPEQSLADACNYYGRRELHNNDPQGCAEVYDFCKAILPSE